MDSERLKQIEEIYHAALEIAPAERKMFFKKNCGADAELRREIESLLSFEESSDNFIDTPPDALAAAMFAERENKTSRVNKEIGRYKIKKLLGRGGMGEVYLAEDTNLNRRVALKFLSASTFDDKNPVRRFKQEAFAASALNHPNILTIYEFDSIGETCFLAAEYIEGETLRGTLRRGGLSLKETLNVVEQIAFALAAAHRANIVHRDIKPENIMLREDGFAKILDFGLAKLTEKTALTENLEDPTRKLALTKPGAVMGTVSYMSPEQVRGRADIDARTDIWSLGVVLFEMLARCAPFAGEIDSDLIASILKTDAPRLSNCVADCPPELERIVDKALAKNVEERYQAIQDLALDIKSLKRRLEFETELERSTAPHTTAPPRTQTNRNALLQTFGGVSSATNKMGARKTSSAEYIFTEIKRRKKSAMLAASFAAIIIAASIFFLNFRSGERALTEKDTILLTDFVNTTGDAVFDGTLKQALAVQLGQSPFLNIFSEDRARDALKFMNRSPDERVTRDVGREICQRQGLKAMLVGSIASLGERYVVTLEAVNAQTGDAIAREQAEAETKEQTLHALGEAAMRLREKLGESLQSIQKFDAPIEQGTTASLEAFKAFSLGVEQQLKGKQLEAVPFFKRAAETDPNFALAYARMASIYYNSRQYDLAAEASQKAYDLRDRVSERERLYISAGYYDNVTGELEKYLETLDLWKRTYPQHAPPHNNLSLKYGELGQFDKAVEEAREAIRLNPNSASGYSLLAQAFVGLNRFDEAQEIIRQAIDKKLETTAMHGTLFRIGFFQGNAAMMSEQIDWINGKPDEYVAQNWQADAAASSGELRKAREFSNRAFELAAARDLKEVAAQALAGAAARDALFGDCKLVKEQAAKALGTSHRQQTMVNAGNALAGCGEFSQAQIVVDELIKRFPKDTILNKVSLPLIQARIELNRGNPAQAIQSLDATRPYEGAALFRIASLRGQAYLNQQRGTEAAAEFQKILDHKGWQALSPLYPLAHLGLARAAALSGDTTKARTAYQDFLALWKNADSDIAILQESKSEYEKLK